MIAACAKGIRLIHVAHDAGICVSTASPRCPRVRHESGSMEFSSLNPVIKPLYLPTPMTFARRHVRQAVTLHWVMYEKAVGMPAADLCESVLAYTRQYYSEVLHVASVRPVRPVRSTTSSGDCRLGDDGVDLTLVGDSEFVCAARGARVLHGMLSTIHEV